MSPETWTCQCGARYRLPDSSAGRRVKCTKCGAVVTLPETGPIPLADEPTPSSPARPPPVVIVETLKEPEAPVAPTAGSFWSDALAGLFFIIEPDNLLAFVVVWLLNLVLVAALVFANPFLLLAALFGFGWLVAYYMSVVLDAAAGEPDLPSTHLLGDPIEDLLKPLLVFVITWLVLLAPAYILSQVVTTFGWNVPHTYVTVLVGAATFFWPMVILCISIGGIRVLTRCDLMIVSVFRSLGPYVIVWILLASTGIAGYYLIRPIVQGPPAGGGTSYMQTHALAGTALVSLVLAYASIVAMRVIGLYYRHYKRRFIWSWE